MLMMFEIQIDVVCCTGVLLHVTFEQEHFQSLCYPVIWDLFIEEMSERYTGFAQL